MYRQQKWEIITINNNYLFIIKTHKLNVHNIISKRSDTQTRDFDALSKKWFPA